MNRRKEVARVELLERTKRRIAARVRPVVPHLSTEEFDALVGRMAVIEIKYATRRGADFFRAGEMGEESEN